MEKIGLPTHYQQFIHISRYARWKENLKRRETWEETVDRLVNFLCQEQCKDKVPKDIQKKIRESILKLEVMPSMRCLMTAGDALRKDQVAAFNCSYVAIDNIAAFDEMMYILMCGSGAGFSVERQFIAELPVVAERMEKSNTVIQVGDSRVGWARAYRELISMLYQGSIPRWDISKVRPAGAKLKTFGGRASGPQPLVELFKFTIEKFKGAVGRKLTSIECHDICCKIGEIVVSGGVRRSALLSLSNPSDDRMRHAKDGKWFDVTPWRKMANNSVCYTEKPDAGVFMREWLALYDSKSGERGIFNRQAAVNQAKKYGRREFNFLFGCNPCSEIILRSCQFCNLSEVIIRPDDTKETIKRKVEIAVILGTMQATLTNFRYLRKEWKRNTEEEALLGVSLTGIMDNLLTSGKSGKEDNYKELKEFLNSLREYAVEVNREWAERLGINSAVAVTCVKPSGTVSQLTDSASGIHSRFAKRYIRRVRCDKKDPLPSLMHDMGFPMEVDSWNPENQVIFSFPFEVPEGSIVTEDMTAIEQLEMWMVYQESWCEHKPSMTVYINENEWVEVGAWVYKNFDRISGISFLPYTGHTYTQAPYEEIDKEEYEKLLSEMPKDVDWSRLCDYEEDDSTINYKELACTGGSCEVVDLVSEKS